MTINSFAKVCRRAFDRSGDFEVVGEAGSIADAERLLDEPSS